MQSLLDRARQFYEYPNYLSCRRFVVARCICTSDFFKALSFDELVCDCCTDWSFLCMNSTHKVRVNSWLQHIIVIATSGRDGITLTNEWVISKNQYCSASNSGAMFSKSFRTCIPQMNTLWFYPRNSASSPEWMAVLAVEIIASECVQECLQGDWHLSREQLLAWWSQTVNEPPPQDASGLQCRASKCAGRTWCWVRVPGLVCTRGMGVLVTTGAQSFQNITICQSFPKNLRMCLLH